MDASVGDSRKPFWRDFPQIVPYCSPYRVLEMQIIIATLVENFEFSLPPQTEKTRIRRKRIGMMAPVVEGRQGAWMGLGIKSLEE